MPRWKKQGRIFNLEPAPNRSTHAQVPTVLDMGETIRVYYACRNNGKAFPAFFDLERKTFKVVNVHEQPIMELGKPGNFDADGVMPSCVIRQADEYWMYFIGWNARAEGARYQNEIGIATSKDGVNFERKFKGPIIGRSPSEPGLAVMPFILYKNWFRCYYQSGVSWEKIGGNYEPIYVIKYADSLDGINWDRNPAQCIKSDYPLEAFSRPSILLTGNTWHMYYCHRGSHDYRGGKGSYRIGYAQSPDGINFTRMDSMAGIDVGEKGEFDSDMICYPYVIKIDDRLIMFYNGNSFGQTGIGWAVWDD